MRTCIGCREVRPARALVRCRLDASGTRAVVGDDARRQAGRGAWLCAGSGSCVESAIARRAFARAWKCTVGVEVLDSIRGQIEATGTTVDAVTDAVTDAAADAVVGNRKKNMREWSAAGNAGAHTRTKG